MKKVIWLVLAVAIILVAYFVFVSKGPSYQPQPAVAPQPQTPQQVAPSAVSADPDVFAADLLNRTQQEFVTPEESNPSLTSDNSQAINNFDQSSNPSQF